MTGWLPPTSLFYNYIGEGVTCMTAFEIISTFIGILTLLFTFGGFVIAFLAFLDKRNKH
jgi:hypothetical protein